MKEQKYTCDMIADLIPLCSEGLCSEESRAAVEAHIAECESCRRLYEAGAEQTVPQPEMIPDEAKVFKKVHRKITKYKWLDRILLVLLIAVLAPVIYLTYGQIFHRSGVPSFETVIESRRIKSMAEEMGRGDFSTFVSYMSCEQYQMDGYLPWDYITELRSNANNLLSESFEQSFGNTKLKSVRVDTGYTQYFYTEVPETAWFLYSNALLEFENGRFLELDFHHGADGGYRCEARETYNSGYTLSNGMPPHHDDTTEYRNRFCEAMFYINDPDVLAPRGWLEQQMVNFNGIDTESGRKTAADSIAMRFSETVRDRIYDNVFAFNEKYSFTFVEISHIQYDTDNSVDYSNYDGDRKKLYWTMTVEAEDEKGKAIMTTRFSRDVTGLVPQDASLNTVYTDGCTPELAEALRTFFTAESASVSE